MRYSIYTDGELFWANLTLDVALKEEQILARACAAGRVEVRPQTERLQTPGALASHMRRVRV